MKHDICKFQNPKPKFSWVSTLVGQNPKEPYPISLLIGLAIQVQNLLVILVTSKALYWVFFFFYGCRYLSSSKTDYFSGRLKLLPLLHTGLSGTRERTQIFSRDFINYYLTKMSINNRYIIRYLKFRRYSQTDTGTWWPQPKRLQLGGTLLTCEIEGIFCSDPFKWKRHQDHNETCPSKSMENQNSLNATDKSTNRRKCGWGLTSCQEIERRMVKMLAVVLCHGMCHQLLIEFVETQDIFIV